MLLLLLAYIDIIFSIALNLLMLIVRIFLYLCVFAGLVTLFRAFTGRAQ
ncbi:MAG: hypothetical protein IJM79_04290 [Erysipelotrichaceae bacterium]|nr:hypothetical protein [Erysipelotrichaceae bacterium]